MKWAIVDECYDRVAVDRRLVGGMHAQPLASGWQRHRSTARIIDDLGPDLFDCKNLVCGRIAWIKDPRRRPTQCGRMIIWGLAAAVPSNGRVDNPRSG